MSAVILDLGAILFDRTGGQVTIPADGTPDQKREMARQVDPWSPAYLDAQAKASARVAAMSFGEKDEAKHEINRRLVSSQKIKSDGGLIRHMTVDIIAGVSP
jgi:hypothetical protein